MRLFRWNTFAVIGAVWCVLLISGCAAYSPAGLPSSATVGEVTQAMGKPSGKYPLDHGGERLEFARGPFGSDTWMVDFDNQGHMLGWSQVLTEQNFNALHIGMTREQVLERIGHPSHTSQIARQGRELWSYRYETPFCQWFQVSLDYLGQVVDTGYGPDPQCEVGDDMSADWSQ